MTILTAFGLRWLFEKMETKVQMPALPATNAGSVIFPASVLAAKQATLTSANASREVAQPQAQETVQQQKKLQQLVRELQRRVQVSAPNLQFSIDHDTGRTVVKVIDANTNEIIRQIPADEILRLAKEIDRMQGLLLHKQG